MPEKGTNIRILSDSYRYHLNKVLEHESGISLMEYQRYIESKNLCRHVENAVNYLQDEQMQLIVRKEVLEGKRGKWYKEYFSLTTYYRIREKSYKAFLNYL